MPQMAIVTAPTACAVMSLVTCLRHKCLQQARRAAAAAVAAGSGSREQGSRLVGLFAEFVCWHVTYLFPEAQEPVLKGGHAKNKTEHMCPPLFLQ